MTETPQTRLAALGLTLPQAVAPVATYVPAVACGKLLIVSGQLPFADGKLKAVGQLGETVSLDVGKECAAICFLNVLAQVQAVTGSLSRIRQIVRLGGFMARASSFTQHAAVMNGASDLSVEIFGEAGRHARATVGVASLPLGAPVEIEAMIELV